MDWLTQNWVWIARALGVGLYFFGSGLGGRAATRGGVPGGMRHGGQAGAGGHGGHCGRPEDRAPADAPLEHAHNVAGYPVRPVDTANERPRRRGGCC